MGKEVSYRNAPHVTRIRRNRSIENRTECSRKIVFSLAKNWAGISCTKIGVTVHGVDDSFENLLQRYVGEGGGYSKKNKIQKIELET